MNKGTRNRRIWNRISSDYAYIENLGYNLFCLALQGSQNYSLDYEKSDIDTKAVIIPSLEDIALNRKPVSTTIVLPSNEHIDVKDIRLMFDCFKKQNINFVEILFTDFYMTNDTHEENLMKLFRNKEIIAHYNNYAAINCIVGMMMEKRAALCHPYPSKIVELEKYGYDPKQLHHIYRLSEFLDRYINGEPYVDCLKSRNKDFLIKVKAGESNIKVEEAIKLANEMTERAKNVKKEYMEQNPVLVNRDVETLLNNVLVDAIRDQLKNELQTVA